MAVKSRIDAWTLLRVLVVPCLFLCAIFKRPIFQWIACAALFVWVCFVISKLFRAHRKHCKKMPAEQKLENKLSDIKKSNITYAKSCILIGITPTGMQLLYYLLYYAFINLRPQHCYKAGCCLVYFLSKKMIRSFNNLE